MSRIALPPRYPEPRPGVWLRRAGDENALIDTETDGIHLLNDTAVAIWELCDGRTTPEEMIEAICELCDTVYEMVADDVERVLHDFTHLGLIDWRSEPAAEASEH